MIRVIVSGACGKMGSRLISLISQDKEMQLWAAVEEENHPRIGKTIIGDFVVTDKIERSIKEADVVIEFTNPIATIQHAAIASQAKKAMVIGTTGFSEEQISHLKELAKNFPCVMAPNMSIGANLMFKITEEVAKTLGEDYEAEIIEAHHNQKKDAPSGTAKKLGEAISKVKGKMPPMHSVRLGDIVGEHTVIFAGPGERIELTHRAHSRDVFAYGAIKAAKWIVGKPAGLYDMQDVLGIK